jgi:hypothetical protein
MYSNWYTNFSANDAATISQSVNLAGVEQLVFDLHLYADNGAIWNPDIVTARVLIDDKEVWNSDGLQFTAGQFEGEVAIDVNQNLKDGNPHLLSLQLRVDVGIIPTCDYLTQWDFVRFSYSCRLPGDLTGDCIVDINDLNELAQGWLSPTGPDLTGDGTSNFADFAVLADYWQTTGDSNTSSPQDNLLDADLNDDGIVDFDDLPIFCNDWLGSGGPCVRADINADGVVDIKDYCLLAGSWQFKGSLYGW